MSAPEQTANNLDGLVPGTPLELSVLEGGAQVSVNDRENLGSEESRFGVIRVEVRETDDDFEHRVEVLTLRNGRRYTCTVTEADPDQTPEIGSADLAILVPGFTEIPSSKNSTASNLHEAYAGRNRDKRVVSVDRIGYSSYAGPGSPVEAVRLALQNKQQAASDLIEVTANYASRQPVTILATSAGFDTVVEVIKQNGEDKNRPELNIGKVYGAVPCVVAKNEKEYEIFRAEEPENLTRIKTIIRFGGHCAINLVGSTIKNPKGTWDSRGIVSTWAKHPLLLVMLPVHFAGHTEGSDFIDIVDAARKHGFILVSGEDDPLTAEEQYRAVNRMLEREDNKNRIDHRIKPNRGHVCYPIAVEELLDDLDITRPIAPLEPTASDTNVLEGGLRLVTSTAEQVASIATKNIVGVGRLGGRVLSSVLGHESAQAA